MPPGPAQLARLARLRAYVGALSRIGEWESTVDALLRLHRADRESGLPVDALRHAWQAAAVARLGDSTTEQGRALLTLSITLLENGDGEGAGLAAGLALEVASTKPAGQTTEAQLVAALAMLLAGVAARSAGDGGTARARLDEARDRLAALGDGVGAASALVELGALDLDEGEPQAAAICFRFAGAFFHQAGRPGGEALAATLAAAALLEAGDAEGADEAALAALALHAQAEEHAEAAAFALRHAERLSHAGLVEAARQYAGEAARLAAGPSRADADPDLVAGHARLLLAGLATDVGERLRHAEAAFDLALVGDAPALAGACLDLVVAALSARPLSEADWRPVARFADDLLGRGWDDLARLADEALRDLRPRS